MARLAYAHARSAGVDVRGLLKAAGLTDLQIKEKKLRLTVQQQIEFLNIVAKALRDDFLGFHLAQTPDLREMGLLYYVAASSETFGDALQRAARYCSIVNEGLSLKCFREGGIRLVFEYVGVTRHSDRHQIEFLMTLLIRLCRQLTGFPLTPCRVRIAHRRSNRRVSGLATYFGRDITFGARADELTFAEKFTGIDIRSADPYLNELLVANCERALAHRRTNRGSYRAAVENAIVPLLPHGKVSALLIALKLDLADAHQRAGLQRRGQPSRMFFESYGTTSRRSICRIRTYRFRELLGCWDIARSVRSLMHSSVGPAKRPVKAAAARCLRFIRYSLYWSYGLQRLLPSPCANPCQTTSGIQNAGPRRMCSTSQDSRA